jgi:bifunctional non-homologous end joining protein LigD
MSGVAELEAGGIKVPVSNLDKVLYPRTGFTKGEVIDYYIRVSPVLLPHLKNRPVTLKRYPDGVEGFFFYERECPAHRPKWIKTAKATKTEGGHVNYCLINDLPSLIWAANLADLELHTFLHVAPKVSSPTSLTFDLDPGAPAAIRDCCAVALRLKAVFDGLRLKSFPKTSGSKGLQVVVPLNTPATYAVTKEFARSVAALLEQQLPRLVVSKMQRSLRKGKVLVDWSQNDAHKTTVCVYSLRAKERPTVSTPLIWDEVAAAEQQRRRAGELAFEPVELFRRIESSGDLFEPVLRLTQRLPSVDQLEP